MANRSKEIKCIQINLRHSRAAMSNLMHTIIQQDIDLVFAQEPYLIDNKVAGVSRNYRIFTNGDHRIRAAIIVTNQHIDAMQINQISNEDAVVLEIIHDNLKAYAGSMYFDIERDINVDLMKLDNFLTYARGKGIIIGMDSNSRSKVWHDVITNARGKLVEEYLASNNLYVINEESENTTFENNRGKSNVDLTITNNLLLPRMNEWECSEEESCSDHRYITYSISHHTTHNRTANYYGSKFIIKEEKLEEFSNVLVRELSNRIHEINSQEIISTEDIDEQLCEMVRNETDTKKLLRDYTAAINAACNICYKRSKPSERSIKKKTVPWWTDALTILRKRTNALRRRYQRTKNDGNLREQRRNTYFEEKRKYERAIKNEKINSWKSYCSLTPTNNPWNAVYRMSSGKIRKTPPLTTLKKLDGSVTTDINETLNYMINHFVPEDKENEDNEYHRLIREETRRPIDTPDDRAFTQQEIKGILTRMNPKKAPGEDGINSTILLQVFKLFPRYMTTIYNTCLKHGYFPQQWKKAILIPIIKPGKDTSQDVSKYRPISLINIGGKVLEKLLIDRIMHHVFSNDLMNQNQYGFTPTKSTTDALMAVKEYVQQSLEDGQFLVLVSLDVQGAFDAAWWPSIMNALRTFNCPQNLYNLVRSYFNQRRASLCVNHVKTEKDVTKGCPQGSCCGPGLWNIQYNSLLNLEYTNHTKVIAFADDLLVMTKGKTLLEAENFANVELQKISNWSKNNKIKYNEQKSKVLLITKRRRKIDTRLNIFLNYKLIEQVTTMKYLGIVMDEKFNFNAHIQQLADRSTRLINALSRSAKLDWGLSHGALRTIYKGAILPLLSYGIPAWIESLQNKSNRMKLIRVQRLMNIKIAKAFRTTSTEALCTITGLTPIIIKLQEISKAYNKLKGKDNDNLDMTLSLKEWPHPAKFPVIENVDPAKDYAVEIYTDGSKSKDGVGAGFAILHNGQIVRQLQYKLDDRCSNNQAEQLAILKALEKTPEVQLTLNAPKTIALYTDSKITLYSIQNSRNHNNLIEKIRKTISKLSSNHWTVAISWIEAHIGIYGNELADHLAKQAARSNEPIAYNKVPKSGVLKILREESIRCWEREWRDTKNGAETKKYFPSIAVRLAVKMPVTSGLTTMMTGHGRINAYFYRFHIAPDPICPCGGGDQTVDHLLLSCPRYNIQRQILRKSVINKGGTWPPDRRDLVGKHQKDFCKYVNIIDFSAN